MYRIFSHELHDDRKPGPGGAAMARKAHDVGSGLFYSESWRKDISPPRGSQRKNLRAENAKIEVLIASVSALARSANSLKVLSAEEAFEFSRIRVAAARDSVIAGRTLLRLALSRAIYNRIAASDWRFAAEPSGRTAILNEAPQLHFSVSHTERLAVVAVSRRLPVGIDAESVEQTVETNVASYICCETERAALETLPEGQSTREFLRLWTLKEAYAKMIGRGAALDFAELGFSFDTLHLAQHPDRDEAERHTHFETMFVSSGNGLTHLSLAVGFPPALAAQAELQVVTVADSEKSPAAIHLPCICS